MVYPYNMCIKIEYHSCLDVQGHVSLAPSAHLGDSPLKAGARIPVMVLFVDYQVQSSVHK